MRSLRRAPPSHLNMQIQSVPCDRRLSRRAARLHSRRERTTISPTRTGARSAPAPSSCRMLRLLICKEDCRGLPPSSSFRSLVSAPRLACSTLSLTVALQPSWLRRHLVSAVMMTVILRTMAAMLTHLRLRPHGQPYVDGRPHHHRLLSRFSRRNPRLRGQHRLLRLQPRRRYRRCTPLPGPCRRGRRRFRRPRLWAAAALPWSVQCRPHAPANPVALPPAGTRVSSPPASSTSSPLTVSCRLRAASQRIARSVARSGAGSSGFPHECAEQRDCALRPRCCRAHSQTRASGP